MKRKQINGMVFRGGNIMNPQITDLDAIPQLLLRQQRRQHGGYRRTFDGQQHV
ncbi:MAG: hypothetical protein OXI38_00095 [Bacteroidota bacterium]|nr:hypothetical protein [Bacteroidota bacterium]